MKPLFLLFSLLFVSVSVCAQEFREDKFALTYYNFNYSPRGDKAEPYFIITGVDKEPEKVDPVVHLHRDGKPGAFNFSKFKNKWFKGPTVYLSNPEIKFSRAEQLFNLLKIKKNNQNNYNLFVCSGVFTVKKTGNYRFKSEGFVGVGTSPSNLRTVYVDTWFNMDWSRGELLPPRGNNSVKVEFEPKSYKEQWGKYRGHWLNLVAGTKYYFVACFIVRRERGADFSLCKIMNPDEETTFVVPFKYKPAEK